MRVALMQEDRQARLRRELELPLECVTLCVARREVTEIVQPAFADRNGALERRQLA